MATAKKKPKAKPPAPLEDKPEKGTPAPVEEEKPLEEKPKKRGRPKGAKSKPKAEDIPRKKRKQPEEIKDTGHALKRYAEDYNKVAKRHNDEHGTAVPLIAEDPLQNQGPKKLDVPTIPAEVAATTIGAGCEILGQMWGVETRPDETALKAAGEAWAELSKYFVTINPVWVAAGAAIGATGGCVLPMYMEKAARDRGEKPPQAPAPGEV